MRTWLAAGAGAIVSAVVVGMLIPAFGTSVNLNPGDTATCVGTTTTTTVPPTTTTTIPPTTTTTVPPTTTTTAATGTAGFGQPVMAAPPGHSTLLMDDTFGGTTLNASHWSTVMGGPVPDVGKWGGYGGTPVVNNGLTLTNANGTASMVDTANPSTGRNLFSFPQAGFYLQVNFKVSDTSHGFWPAIWFPFDNNIHPHANEIDLFEGGMTGGGVPYNNSIESNYGGASSQDPNWKQVFANAGVDITQNFVTVGMEFVPGNHVNFYVGQGASRKLILSDTNAADIGAFANYNLVMTPQNGGSVGGWHSSGTGTGSMYIAEVQVYG